ncbi:MAG: lysylphosphatidylglycerol synthase domain-containing protein, partial [Deltaproteobacteria bacterium]
MSQPKSQSDARAKSHRTRRVLLGLVTVILVAVGLAWFASDGRALMAAATKISWVAVLLPIAATLISYALMAASYEGIATAAHKSIGFREMHRITYVSNTINYIVSTGGLSGFAARMYLFRKHGIPLGRAVTISFVQGLLTNLTLLLFLIVGFAFLVTHESLGRAAIASAAAALGIFTTATLVLVSLFLHPRSRRNFLLRIVGAGLL